MTYGMDGNLLTVGDQTDPIITKSNLETVRISLELLNLAALTERVELWKFYECKFPNSFLNRRWQLVESLHKLTLVFD